MDQHFNLHVVLNVVSLVIQGQDRLDYLPLDVASDASVKAAAEQVREKFGSPALYGIVNNAGVGFQNSMADTLNINTYGPKRVCDNFLPLLEKDCTFVVDFWKTAMQGEAVVCGSSS